MTTTEIKRELHNYIEIGNDDFVEWLYKVVREQLYQMEMDRMIEEAEEDIRAGRVYSSEEIEKMIKDWRK
jgi:hypothetical protein